MPLPAPTGIDSQCLTYLVTAIHGVDMPVGALSAERIALFRAFLFEETAFYVTPTVESECARIADSANRRRHLSCIGALFCRLRVDEATVAPRAQELRKHHAGMADCRIFAEAECGGLRNLLTYDRKLVDHLGDQSASLHLIRPLEYWNGLGIPRGTSPRWLPERSNPLHTQDWWHW